MRVYETQGICAKYIEVDTDGKTLKDMRMYGGCPGQGKALLALCKGQPLRGIIKRLKGVDCHGGTSCSDQLARALEMELELHKNKGVVAEQ